MFAAVESDIVGYTQIEMQAGKWYQVGTPFIPLTDGAEQTLNNTFTTGFATNDQVYVYDPEMGSYKGPYVWGTANGQTGWWNTTTGSLTTTALTPGQAVFIKKNTSGDVVLPGRVSTTTAVSFGSDEATDEDTSSWAQVVCLYPAERKLNDMEWSGLSTNDQVYVYDPEMGSYKGPYVWGTANGQTGWWNTTTSSLTTTALAPGQAIFINKRSSGVASLLPGVASSAE